MEKVSSAAQALQARADGVPALERRVAQLEAAAVAADEALAGARAEAAAALQRAEKAEAASPSGGSGRDGAAPEADQQQVCGRRATVGCGLVSGPLLPHMQPYLYSLPAWSTDEGPVVMTEHQHTIS